MSLKKTFFFALVLGAIFLYISKVELPRQRSEEEQKELLPGVRRSAISAIAIERNGEKFKLVNSAEPDGKSGDEHEGEEDAEELQEPKWMLEGVTAADLDKASINALLSALREFRLESRLPDAEVDSDLSIYGLQNPAITLTVHFDHDSREVRFGKLNEFVDKRYVTVSGHPGIFMVPENTFAAADRPAEDFRNKAPISFQDSDIEKIRYVSGSEQFELSQTAPGDWKLTAPVSAAADPAKVSELTRDVRNLRAVKFLDGATQNPAEFGLDKPESAFTIQFRGTSNKEPLKISVGRVSKSPPPEERKGKDAGKERKEDRQELAYFSSSDRPSIYQTNPAFLGQLKFTADGLRERHLFAFQNDRVKSVTFQPADGAEIKMIKGVDGRWTINGKPGDDVFVEQAVANLAGLQADAFPRKEHSFGFEKPRLKVVVELNRSGDKEPGSMTLVIGNAFKSEDLKKTAYYAATDDLASPFMISEQTFKNIFFHEEALVKTASDNESGAPSAGGEAAGVNK